MLHLNRYKFGLFLLLGYLFFVPIGPFPINLIYTVKVDTLFSIILFLFLITHVRRIFIYPKYLLLSIALYFMFSTLSTVLSNNTLYSFKYLIVIAGYCFVSLIVPTLYVDSVSFLRRFLFFISVIISVLINILHFGFDYGRAHRFALSFDDVSARGLGSIEGISVVDPNMTAAGLALSLLIYLPLSNINTIKVISSTVIISAILIMQSRSSIVGILGALTLSSIIIFSRQLLFRYSVKKIHLKVVLLVFIVSIILISILNLINIQVYERFFERLLNSSSDSRVLLFYEAWDIFFESIKTIMFGSGFMTTNPHNEFLRALSSTGILGLFSYILFLSSSCYYTLKLTLTNKKLFHSSLLIILFTLIITQFYGYTKLLWIAWMFLLFNMLESRVWAGLRSRL
jgi:hypothetical protein